MMNNDSALQLSNVLNRECTRSQVHCQSKKRALEIISELAAKQLSLPPQVVFEAILTREKMGSTGIGNGIAHSPRKTGRGYAACCRRFVQLETPSPSTRSTINLSTCCSRCWCRPTRQNSPAYALPGGQTAGGQSDLSSPARAAQSDEELYEIITEAGSSDDA